MVGVCGLLKKLEAPNSPNEMVNEKARLAIIARSRIGKSTSRKTLHGFAPITRAASLKEIGVLLIAGISVRMANGSAIRE